MHRAAAAVTAAVLALPLLAGTAAAGSARDTAAARGIAAASVSSISSTADRPVVTPSPNRATAPEVALTTAGRTYDLVVGADVPVWFRFTAPRDAVAFVTLSKGGALIYQETADGLVRAGMTFPLGTRPQTTVVEAGAIYVAEVVGDLYSSNTAWAQPGLAELSIRDMSPPNDVRSQAINLPVGAATHQEYRLGWALDGQGDPACGTNKSPATMWYRFTAPSKGTLTTRVNANFGASSHAIYSVDKRDRLKQVACYPYRPLLDGPVVTPVKAGTTYYVMVQSDSIPTAFTASSYNYTVTINSSFASSKRK